MASEPGEYEAIEIINAIQSCDAYTEIPALVRSRDNISDYRILCIEAD